MIQTTDYPVFKEPSFELWHSFLTNFPEGILEQTFEYGEATRMAFPHSRVVRLIAMDGDEPLGIAQGIYSRNFGFGKFLKVSNAPLTNGPRGKDLHVVASLLEALENYGIRNRVISVQVWWPRSWGMQDTFRGSRYEVVKEINRYIVDLNGVDELWKNIAHNKRRNIKKAIEMGVEVVQSCHKSDIRTFFQLLEESGKRQGFSVDPFSWFEAIWRVYNDPCSFSRVFLARWNGKDVAGVFITIHGKTVYALAAGSSSHAWKVRPNDLLHWKVMEWACEQEFSKYSMGFVSEPVPTKGCNSRGIWRWKREWKGNLVAIQVLQKLLIPQIFNKVFLPSYRHISRARNMTARGF